MPKNQQQSVFTSVTLPSGLVLKNRLVKAAMEENLADADLTPSQVLKNCYRHNDSHTVLASAFRGLA